MGRVSRRRNHLRLLVRFRRFAFRPPLGEPETGVSESKNRAPDSNPEQTVPKKQAADTDGESVFVGNSPVFGDHGKCPKTKRVKHGPNVLQPHVLKKLTGHRATYEQENCGNKGSDLLAPHNSRSKQNCSC